MGSFWRPIVLAAVGLLGIAQEGSHSGEYKLKISVDLIQVDATITDAKGNPVRDLKPDDFVVVIDGEARTAKYATYIDIPFASSRPRRETTPAKSDPAMPPAPGIPELKAEDVKRTIVLFVDDISLSSERIPAVRRGVRQAIEALEPGDLAAVVRSGAGPGALRDFTNDKTRLLAAADQIRWNPKGRGEPEAYYRIGRDPVAEMVEANSDSLGQELERLRTDVFAVATLDALDRVIRGLEQLPGRKVIVMLADNISLSSRVISEGPGSKASMPTRDFGGFAPGTAARVVERAARAGVVINAIDTRGLSPLTMTAADRPKFETDTVGPSATQMTPDHVAAVLNNANERRKAEYLAGQESGSYLAAETGGIMVTESNDVGGSIAGIYSRMTGYYLLGIEPPRTTFERNKDGSPKFRAIAVSVRRPGVRVRTRSGFLGITDADFEPPKDRAQMQLAASLDSPFRQVGVATTVRCAFINVEKTRSIILTRVGIAARDLSLEGPVQNRSAIVHLIVRAYGIDGAELEGGIDQRLKISLDQQGTRVSLANGLVYSTNVSVSKPGPYQIRAAILDEASGRIGTGSEFLIVPKLGGKRVVLSDLTFPSYFGTENRVTPAWERLEVAPGQWVRFAFQAFNAGSRSLGQQTRLYRDGQCVYESAVSPLESSAKGKGGQLVANGQLRVPEGLEPGDYYLQVEVADAGGGKSPVRARRWAKVTVTPSPKI
jgi:VWFA-related protein